ncbi:hypothetical protein CCUS01_00156 [Colletotrichum cuscutae]|uniref:Uncharacterized protein n=1 Tax=Colletotrichum cuscutae TaxID=1209917 RepID=A0AAI9YDW3_9PEZI|nr:hypothetical protein CCUS01_00156 [Colletotrichum cuscutae]
MADVVGTAASFVGLVGALLKTTYVADGYSLQGRAQTTDTCGCPSTRDTRRNRGGVGSALKKLEKKSRNGQCESFMSALKTQDADETDLLLLIEDERLFTTQDLMDSLIASPPEVEELYIKFLEGLKGSSTTKELSKTQTILEWIC